MVIVDEVQHALASHDGEMLMLALRAARDAVNTRPKTAGYLLFVGAGSHRSLIGDMTAKRNQASAGAVAMDFPLLGRDYVDFVLQRLRLEGAKKLPRAEAVMRAFDMLDRRPEELVKALRLTLAQVEQGADAAATLSAVAHTLRAEAANVEIMRAEQLGHLARAVLARIARADGPAKGAYSQAAMKEYASAVGLSVTLTEVQRVVNSLVAANLVMRRAHGLLDVADPSVREALSRQRALRRAP